MALKINDIGIHLEPKKGTVVRKLGIDNGWLAFIHCDCALVLVEKLFQIPDQTFTLTIERDLCDLPKTAGDPDRFKPTS